MRIPVRVMVAVVSGAFAANVAVAVTCTFNDGWDVPPSDAGDEIVISSGALVWDDALPAKVASWSQTGGTVTFEKAFDAPLEVTGVVTLSGGTWTHAANPKAKYGSTDDKHRVYVKCGGDMTITDGATISADYLGYESCQVINGYYDDSKTWGGSYGGHGGYGTEIKSYTYGSLFAPEDLGNIGKWLGAQKGAAGAIRLDVGGKLIHNGVLTANGRENSYYTGAGGSIYIHAASIEGSGTMTANGGKATSGCGGAGGRIAVILTGAGSDFSKYDIYANASARAGKIGDGNQGGCGTIYAETLADGANHGWLILKGTGTEPTKSTDHYADPFSDVVTSLRLSKITIAGKTKLAVRSGNVLDVTDTTFDCRDAGYGLYLNGGSLVADDGKICTIADAEFPSETTLAGSFVIASGTVKVSSKLTVTGGLTLKTGALVKPVSNKTLHLVVNGDLTAEEGSSIDMTGMGYGVAQSPDGTTSESCGGTHGGWGTTTGRAENGVKPYGSIVDPQTYGTGGLQNNYGNSSPGGGAVRLEVGGALTMNGSICANGKDFNHYAGAGGSVNITAASLSGGENAVIEANGGKASNGTAGAAGGRIAVKLTGEGADFSRYLGAMTAYGFCKGTAGETTKRGAAGTVYRQTAAQGETGGTLIVDNGAAADSTATLLGDRVEGLAFGDVIIRNKARVKLADGATLTVSGNFANSATFAAGVGATVAFAGAGESVVSGNTTFVNLACTTPGKTISFASGSTQKVTGKLTLEAAGEPVTVRSTVAGEPWYLDAVGASFSITGAALGDWNSNVPLTATESEDLGGNSDNISIVGKVESQTLTWTGAASDEWSDPANWTGGDRAPIKIDTAVVPVTDRAPVVDADYEVGALVAEGTLVVAGKRLTVYGPVSVSGAINAEEGSQLVVSGDVAMTGTLTPSVLTLVLAGTDPQEVTFAGQPFADVTADNSEVTFAGAVACNKMTLGNPDVACDYRFAADFDLTAYRLVVNGNETTANVTLAPALAEGSWTLSVLSAQVRGALVSGSDATGGYTVYPEASVDEGGNVNWNFNDERIHWTGAAGTDNFATPGNWKGGVVPSVTDAVVIEGSATVRIAEATQIADLTVGLGATLTVDAALTVDGTLMLESAGTLVDNELITVTRDVVLGAGSTVQTKAATASPTHKVHFIVSGDMTVAPGAKIDVTGRGCTRNRWPGGDMKNDSSGGTHGGWGAKITSFAENGTPPYGSIVNPVLAGSGGGQTVEGNATSGGGVIWLEVGGTLTLDGSLVANGNNFNHYAGAGGSVNITAGRLVGGAHSVISADAGGASIGTSAAGGGRIAIKLTGEGADFSRYLGAMTAYGYRYGTAGETGKRGGAGTIYLRTAAQGKNGGILIVDNGKAKSSCKTLVGGDVEGTAFDNVIVRGGANLALADGATLTVSGDFVNEASFTAGAESTVAFVGAGESVVSGDTTFANFRCETPGKAIVFAEGSTQKVTEKIVVDGGEGKVTLKAASPEGSWSLDLTGASVSMGGVALGGCQAVSAFTATESEDLGGNSANVTIIGALEPQTLTWTGAVSTEWGDAGNWTGGDRAPLQVDTAVVPVTDRAPVIEADVEVVGLRVAGALVLNGKTIFVRDALEVSGSLTVTEGAEIVASGAVTLSGELTPDVLTLRLNGAVKQVVRLSGVWLKLLSVEGASAALAGSARYTDMVIDPSGEAGAYDFASDFAAEVELLTVDGLATAPNVTLKPSVSGETWVLNAKAASVTGARVSGSVATGGRTAYPRASVDDGGNANWVFADPRVHWTGAAGTDDFAADGNWSGGMAPSVGEVAVIEGDVAVRIGAEAAVAELVVGLGAKLTVNAPLVVSGSVVLEPYGTLVDNRPMTVGGDFLALGRSVLTHDSNTGTPNNRIEIEVAGSGSFAPTASVTAKGKGYRADGYRGPGVPTGGDSFAGASHGGWGYYGNSTPVGPYGSIANPTTVGSAGGWGGSGGGAVILRFGGALTLDAEVNADGNDSDRNYYTASGGSVNLKAASIAGAGDIHANAGNASTGRLGGGGRVAVVLTGAGADFCAYTGAVEALGGRMTGSGKAFGSAGTVFKKAADDPHGTVVIANRQTGGSSEFEAMDRTDFPKTQDNDPKEVKNVALRLGTKSTLNLTADATVSSLSFDSDDARILLNGHKLYVLGTAKRSVKEFVRARATPGEDADGNPGGIVWLSGFTLLVR